MTIEETIKANKDNDQEQIISIIYEPHSIFDNNTVWEGKLGEIPKELYPLEVMGTGWLMDGQHYELEVFKADCLVHGVKIDD